jgi:hypothetical protein
MSCKWDTSRTNSTRPTSPPGDMVVFQFIAQGHTVVQAGFEQPCVPIDTYQPSHPTFFSGWYNVSAVDSDNPPTWNLTINDTSPIFYYCSRLDSCLKEQMIGSINQNATYSLQDQIDSIAQAKFMLQPGQPIPDESTASAPTATATATPKPSSVTLSNGAIAGIVVSGVLVLALACAIFWFVGRNRTLKNTLDSHHSNTVDRWVQSTHPSSSIGGGGVTAANAARPPSYGGDPSIFASLDGQKHWEGQPLYTGHGGSDVPPTMTSLIQELAVAEPVEMEETGRGRDRSGVRGSL